MVRRWRLGLATVVVAAGFGTLSTDGALAAKPARSAIQGEAVRSGVISVDAREALRSGQPLRVLVHLEETVAEAATASAATVSVASQASTPRVDGPRLRRALAGAKQPVLDAVGAKLRKRRDFPNLPIFGAEVGSEAELLDLANAPGVGEVSIDEFLRADLSSSLPAIGQPAAVAAGNTGAGTVVAVIDTGVDLTRSAFGCISPGVPGSCRVSELPPDFTTDENGRPWSDGYYDDPCGSMHGTNVSGIVAGTAPGTRLVVADVFQTLDPATGATVPPCTPGAASGAFASDVVSAVNWIVGRKLAGVNIVAVNLSLGGSARFTSACSDVHGIASLLSVGIQPVAAAGNSAVVNGVYQDGISRPACTSGVIPVGATYDSGSVASFSQSGPFPWMLFAPGVDITSAGITMNGTSMASPHVAGAIAVVAAQQPSWTLTQRVNVLLAAARADALEYFVGRVRRFLDLGRASRYAVSAPNRDRATPTPLSLPAAGLGGTTYSSPSGMLWWRFESPGAANLFAHVNGTVAIYPAGSSEPLGWSYCPSQGASSCQRFGLAAGVTYDLGLSGSNGNYDASIATLQAVAPNDDQLSPTFVPVPSTHRANLALAGTSATNPGPPDAGLHSVWYQIAATSVPVVARLSRTDVELAVFSGNQLVSRNVTGGSVVGPFLGGMLLRLSSHDPVTVDVSFEEGRPASNFDEASPLTINGESGRYSRSTAVPFGAVPDPRIGYDAWWRYVAPATGQLRLSTAGSNVDTTLLIRRAGKPDLIVADSTVDNDGAAMTFLDVEAGEVIVMLTSTRTGRIPLGSIEFSWALVHRGTSAAASSGTPTRTATRGAEAPVRPRQTAGAAMPTA